MILAEGKVEFTGSRLHFSINFGSARVIWATARKDAGVVDRDGLENRCILSGTEGSNPSLSATVLSGVEPLLKRKSLAETVFRRGFLFFSPRRRSLEVKLQRPRGEWRGGLRLNPPGGENYFRGGLERGRVVFRVVFRFVFQFFRYSGHGFHSLDHSRVLAPFPS